MSSEPTPVRDRPLHVLTITPFYPRMGNESGGCFVAEPLAEFAKAGIRSTVYAVEPFYRPKPGKSLSAPDAEWVGYPALPGGLGLASAGVGLFTQLKARAKELHRQCPVDVIHAHGALPCGQAAERLSRYLKVPFAVTVHGLDAFSSQQVSGWPGAWCRRASRRVYASARKVIGVSRHVCDEVQRGMGGISTTKVVYNGVDPTVFVPGRDPSEPVLLTVGNLIPIKGHELVLQVMPMLLSEFSTLTWDVIGDGSELNRLQAQAEKMGVLRSVRFRGRQDRAAVAEAFRSCSIFVLPSRYEGLGCVYLEAMASGKAAVGCIGQGIEEVIRHGENGWLITPGNGNELMKALRTLLGDDVQRRRIGEAARQTILERFTLEHQVRALRTIFEECRA